MRADMMLSASLNRLQFNPMARTLHAVTVLYESSRPAMQDLLGFTVIPCRCCPERIWGFGWASIYLSIYLSLLCSLSLSHHASQICTACPSVDWMHTIGRMIIFDTQQPSQQQVSKHVISRILCLCMYATMMYVNVCVSAYCMYVHISV